MINKLDELSKRMDNIILKNRIKGATCFTLSALIMTLGALYYYRAGQITGMKVASEEMTNVFLKRKDDINE